MSDKENGKRLQIWEDLDIDLDRAKRSGERRAERLANSTQRDIGGYYKKTQEMYADIVDNHKWR